MYLDKIKEFQKEGIARGIPSICSAHPSVLNTAMQTFTSPLLIEATCNQVNQFGGYTGKSPVDFVRYINEIAKLNNFPFENIILGGDHLGPSVWQTEPANSAMKKAEILVRDYIKAGFTKIHLDCSMRLADDPEEPLDVEVSARRTARLAMVAETFGNRNLRYVIGTEVPLPGGATEHEEGVRVTKIKDLQRTIEVTENAFLVEKLDTAWERVIALVVQPGVEYGDDFVLHYQPESARELSKFIEKQPMVYEAHSTDYQTREDLKFLVQDHFAILKVGPALTFAFREAIFGLAMIENEMDSPLECSNIISVLDEVMAGHPDHWVQYYQGSDSEIAYKRKYSLSDRIRYYWTHPSVQRAFEKMLVKLNQETLPATLIKHYLPEIFAEIENDRGLYYPDQIITMKIKIVLDDYIQACYLN